MSDPKDGKKTIIAPCPPVDRFTFDLDGDPFPFFRLDRVIVDVLVIGDVMIDQYLIGRCDRISPEAPVQIVDVTESRRTLGGAGNVLASIGALNGKPAP